MCNFQNVQQWSLLLRHLQENIKNKIKFRYHNQCVVLLSNVLIKYAWHRLTKVQELGLYDDIIHHLPANQGDTQARKSCTVYPKKYAHGFVVLCFVVVMQSFIMNSQEVFIHIHQGCFAGTGAIVRLPQCQWSKPDGYGKISQCITTTKHSKAKTVCIFLGIYCTFRFCIISVSVPPILLNLFLWCWNNPPNCIINK